MAKLKREKIVPHLKQKKVLALYRAAGKVFSIQDFIKKFSSTLAPHERVTIAESLKLFPAQGSRLFAHPLTSNPGIGISRERSSAIAIGSRSAFITKRHIKLKGCRPIPDLHFPHEQLDFGAQEMLTQKIQFGSLTAENTMREILAFCFFKKHGIRVLHAPVAVFEYVFKNRSLGFCLVSLSPTETRLEADEDYFGLSIADLLSIRLVEKELGVKSSLPAEVGFKGVGQWWYANEKGKLLV